MAQQFFSFPRETNIGVAFEDFASESRDLVDALIEQSMAPLSRFASSVLGIVI